MTVRCAAEAIFLKGDCPAEDAAALAQELGCNPHAIVDWSGCHAMHTAVFQVLLAVGPQLRGTPAGDFVRVHLAHLLAPPAG